MSYIINSFSSLCLFALPLSGAAVIKAPSEPAKATWSMPDVADQIHLSWLQGPPQMQVFQEMDIHLEGFREEDSRLAFRSARWGMLFDARKMQLECLTLEPTGAPSTETLDPANVFEGWSTGKLDLQAAVDGQVYRPIGGRIPSLEEDFKYSPIHIVESGTWYQHVAVYDLDLVDAEGAKLPAKSWLEIRAWGDRCTFEWFVEPEAGTVPKLKMSMRDDASESAQESTVDGTRGLLAVSFKDGQIAPISARAKALQVTSVATDDFHLGDVSVEFSDISDAWEVKIPRQEWPSTEVIAYPESLLDRISHYDLKLQNPTDEALDVSLRFVHHYHPITGYVPMLLDADGLQTGMQLQNSKNWHILPDTYFPYQGNWINITARLQIAPAAEVDFEYIVAHAQWEGLPASSAAQLSLVGWGYNGFWTQMALGAWGESVCLQPGRTMRRNFITDIRPYMVIGRNGVPYDWTSNVGGADVAKVVDENGRYQLWKGAVREFMSIGPNLSHVRVRETTEDERLQMQIDSYLPRSNSINRSYYKVKIEALEDIAFKDFALFQLGADYYNELDSRKIAWGDGLNLVKELEPALTGKWGRVIEPAPLEGSLPWISLHANAPEPTMRGRAVRGLIVRDFKATLGGQAMNTPWIVATQTNWRLNAELVLPPEVNTLSQGDVIEFTVELDIFPLSADVYVGSDPSLKERLAETPDSWQLTAYEARHQQVEINSQAQSFPANYTYQGSVNESFTVSGHSRMDTVIIAGLPEPTQWQILEQHAGESVELGARYPEEAQPQITYDLSTQSWSAMLSLRFPVDGEERTFTIQRKRSL